MPRTLWFVLIFASLVAAPVRGQGLIDAFVEGFVDGMNDAADDDHHFHQKHNHNGFNNFQQQYPSTHFHKVWVGDHWEYVPHSNHVVYPSNNVVYPSTTVVGPSSTITSSVAVNALPYKGPGVTIRLEEEVGGAVSYVIDGRETATIQAGHEQTLTTKGRYEIRFSRGKAEDGRDFGQARYTITEGNYHFTVTDKGWELLRDKEQPTIVTTPVQPASPSGIKTNALPPKKAPTAAIPSAPAAATTPPAATAVPATNTIPAAATVPPPAAPAVAPPAAG